MVNQDALYSKSLGDVSHNITWRIAVGSRKMNWFW